MSFIELFYLYQRLTPRTGIMKTDWIQVSNPAPFFHFSQHALPDLFSETSCAFTKSLWWAQNTVHTFSFPFISLFLSSFFVSVTTKESTDSYSCTFYRNWEGERKLESKKYLINPITNPSSWAITSTNIQFFFWFYANLSYTELELP